MTMIASCGHDITNSKSYSLSTMDFTTDWENQSIVRCIRYGVYCENCKDYYEKIGVVLKNRSQEMSWVSGKTQYPVVLADGG